METFLQMPPEERRQLCNETRARLDLPAASIEKDFWVCWTLRELFALALCQGRLTFKGGTSLSKGWNLIDRFSEPSERPSIVPFLKEALPTRTSFRGFTIRTVAPRRTFWEKAMLLHEESFRPAGRPRPARLSRHYYDLSCLIVRGVADQALADLGLFERVASHREAFWEQSWVDYSTLRPGSLRLRPAADQMSDWRRDYAAMREMFFSDPPPFEEVLGDVGDFEDRFNSTAPQEAQRP